MQLQLRVFSQFFHQITVEEIPEPEQVGKENVFRAGVLPVLNKKLIALFIMGQQCL